MAPRRRRGPVVQTDRRRPWWGRARLYRRSVHSLQRRSRSWVAAVAAAPRQSWLRSWPAGGPKQAGRGRRRGGRCCSCTRSGCSAGQGVGGARGRPCGDPDEPIVHSKQHSSQGHTQEVGADRGEPQPSAAGSLAQPRTTWALATTAHAARAPHGAAHSTCTDPAPTPDRFKQTTPLLEPRPIRPPPLAQPNPYILDTPLLPLTHHYQDFLPTPRDHTYSLFSRPSWVSSPTSRLLVPTLTRAHRIPSFFHQLQLRTLATLCPRERGFLVC